MAKKKEIRLKSMTFDQSREFSRLSTLLDLSCVAIPNNDKITFSSVKITSNKPMSNENKDIYRNWFRKHHKTELEFEVSNKNKDICVTFISLKA